MFKIESQFMAVEQTLSTNVNTSMVILERLRETEDDVKDLKGLLCNNIKHKTYIKELKIMKKLNYC